MLCCSMIYTQLLFATSSNRWLLFFCIRNRNYQVLTQRYHPAKHSTLYNYSTIHPTNRLEVDKTDESRWRQISKVWRMQHVSEVENSHFLFTWLSILTIEKYIKINKIKNENKLVNTLNATFFTLNNIKKWCVFVLLGKNKDNFLHLPCCFHN